MCLCVEYMHVFMLYTSVLGYMETCMFCVCVCRDVVCVGAVYLGGSVCMCVCLFMCLSFCVSLSASPSVCLFLSVCPPLSFSVCLQVYIYLSVV